MLELKKDFGHRERECVCVVNCESQELNNVFVQILLNRKNCTNMQQPEKYDNQFFPSIVRWLRNPSSLLAAIELNAASTEQALNV